MNAQESSIIKNKNNKNSTLKDFIAIESPLEIRLGHDEDSFQTLAITMCSPDEIEDLVYGYLFTENIITTIPDIVKIKLYNNHLGVIAEVILDSSIDYHKFLNKRQTAIHSSCGICGKTDFENLLTYSYKKFSRVKFNSDIIKSLPTKMSKAQDSFKQTGGLHASALFNLNGELLLIKEDIGRHNALDKLIGCAFKQQLLPLNNAIVLLSGRVSFELVHKALIAEVTTLSAIGSPSSLSIEIAKLNNMNLLGFISKEGFNCY